MAARKSGLTPHVIRVWERRYQAVSPVRTGTNRRLYTDEEIERLTLLRHAVSAGYRISNIASLPANDLRRLLSDTPTSVSAPGEGGSHQVTAEEFVASCLDAIRRMGTEAFEETLTQALLVLGHQGLLRQVVAPLTLKIGELWHDGTLTAAHEHFATAFLRNFLFHGSRPFPLAEGAPSLVVATPNGQLHELGAVIITSAARNLGWRVIYLGASLPAAEIAGAAIQNRARAVALSLVYPVDDPDLPREIAALRKFLPNSVHILAGGRAATAYHAALEQAGVQCTEDLDEFGRQLEAIRRET